MLGNKTWKQKGRNLDLSDSGYTTEMDMDLSARSHEKLASSWDPSISACGPSGQVSAISTTAPITISSGAAVLVFLRFILSNTMN